MKVGDCMGFLSKLFGSAQTSTSHQTNNDSASVSASISVTTRYVEVRQKTKGLLSSVPLDALDGYVSPSGGFVNYARFQVSCINPATKRKNKRVYEVRTSEDACKCAENDGFIGPYEVSVLPSSPPSERQIAYAKTLEAVLPDGACALDVSAIISRITDKDESPVSPKLARQAHNLGLKFSRYHGKTAIMGLAKANLCGREMECSFCNFLNIS